MYSWYSGGGAGINGEASNFCGSSATCIILVEEVTQVDAEEDTVVEAQEVSKRQATSSK